MNKHKAFYCLLFTICVSHAAENKRQQIPDVVIQHSLLQTSFTGAPKHILTQQVITTNGAATLTDMLRSAGGLQLHDASGNGSQAAISMRGFGANAASNTLILLNGIPLTNPDLAPPDINTIPLENISQVEIIAGSESVLYGDQAVGGVINILTDHTQDKNIRLQCSGGSYNARECHARFANFYRDLSYQLSLTGKSTDNYRQHNQYENATVYGSASLKKNSNAIALDYKFTDENMQYPGALTAAQVRQNRRQANNATDYFKDNNQYLHVNLNTLLREKWLMNTDAFFNAMSGSGVLGAPFTQSRGSISLLPQLAITDDGRKYKYGMDVRADRYHLQSPFGLTNNHQTTGGLFALMNTSINDKLAFIIGARGAEQMTQLNTNVSSYTINRAFAATLGITYQIIKNMDYYLRRAGNFRFPKAEENTAGHVPLRTQRGVSYETGITYEKENHVLDVSIYQLNLRDEISFDPLQTPQNPFGTNTNLAPTSRTGSSLSAKLPFNKWLSADMQINYVYARFSSGINAGNHIPMVSDIITRVGILYRIDNNWQLYTEAILTGRQFPANDNANISGAQGGYTVYNFNLRYQYQTFSAGLHVNNIFNKNYYLYTVYQTGAVNEYFYPAPDCNVMLTVNYAFT